MNDEAKELQAEYAIKEFGATTVEESDVEQEETTKKEDEEELEIDPDFITKEEAKEFIEKKAEEN